MEIVAEAVKNSNDRFSCSVLGMVNTFRPRSGKMMCWSSCLLVVMTFARGVFAAGLAVPSGGLALGEVQPGEAVAAEVVVSNDAERAISVSRVKACYGGEAELEPMSVPAKGEAKLTLRMKAQIPGEIAKAVTLELRMQMSVIEGVK